MSSGRTRQFDVDEALDQALEAFWARGCEGGPRSRSIRFTDRRVAEVYAAWGLPRKSPTTTSR